MDFEQTDMTDMDHIRPDGVIDVLDPPPTDIMDEETLDPAALAQNAPKLETVVQLLNQPALARVYVYVCYWGPVSPPEIMDGLELSKSTTYEYVDQLVALGLVDRDDSTRPQQLTADPIIIVEQYAPIVITPTVLHALALQEVDEDVEYFHGPLRCWQTRRCAARCRAALCWEDDPTNGRDRYRRSRHRSDDDHLRARASADCWPNA